MEKNKKLNYLRYILTFILLLSFVIGPVALNSYKNSQSLAKDSSENYKQLLLEAQNSNYENDLEELYNIGRRIRNMIWKIESDMEYEEDHIKYSKLNLMLMGLKNTMDIIDLKAAELKKNFIAKQTNKKFEDKSLIKAPLVEENELTSKFRFLRQISKTKKEKEITFVSNNTGSAGKKAEVPLEEIIEEDESLEEDDEVLDEEEILEEVEDEEEDVSLEGEESDLDKDQEESEEDINVEEDNLEDKEVDEDKEDELEEDVDEMDEEVVSEDKESDDLKGNLNKEDNKNKTDNKSEDTSTKLNIYIDNEDEKIINNRG